MKSRKIKALLLLIAFISAEVAQASYFYAAAAAGGGATYLFQENLEGTGYQTAGWTETGTPDEDYTTTVLDGSQSLNCTAGQSTKSASFSSADEIWGYFIFRFSALKDSRVIGLYDTSGATLIGQVVMLVSGEIGVQDDSFHSAFTVATHSINTTYHVWFRFKKGTGANGEAEIWTSTSTTKPGAGNNNASHSNGTYATQIQRVECVNETGTAANFIFDKIRVDDVNIGSGPT